MMVQDMVTIIDTVKFKLNNEFTIKGSFEGQTNWNRN